MGAMSIDRRCFLIAASPLAFGAAAAWADDDDRRRRDSDDDDDHDRAREALQQGRVRPLAEILAEVHQDLGGHVVGVEFDDEDGTYVYEFKVVTDTGRLKKVYVDATSGRILELEDD
jgi:uncharacterized membrane protein YkoI